MSIAAVAKQECAQGAWNRDYSRCSLFGAALVGTEIFDSNICPHGPQGCLHVVRDATAQQNRETDYAQSGMTQKDVIYGGKETLIAAFLETMGEYGQAGPKISVSTCAPEIIGDNLNDVVTRINPKLPVVAVSGGFQGNQYYGLNETLQKLVAKFADPRPAAEAGLVNVIGNIGGTMQWRADVREMDRLLTALGLTVNYLVCDSTLDNVRRASRAQATILINPEIGAPAADYLRGRFNIAPIISSFGLPLGLRGTEAWLRTVAAALDLSVDKLETVLEREEEQTRYALKVGLNNLVFSEKSMRLKRLPVAVVAEAVSALSWARFLAEELEMRPCVVGLRTAASKHELHPDLTQWLHAADARAVIAEPSIDSVRRALQQFKPHLVLGSSLESDMVRELGLPAFVHVAHPNMHYVNIVEKPYLGYKGMLNVCETILNNI